ncbi:unnamed protein product [Psylliodes chrysocephalus]|uniref:Uncharacterized protein n=1 Tax=Psylliodes chrysocephalus TaxID=3402493 RepID=A0A9P0GC47_9CUCU|nr:unnamed protein product [Psylliodes chrysocephala]
MYNLSSHIHDIVTNNENNLTTSEMLKSCRNLSMTVRSPNLPTSRAGYGGGAPWQMRQTCSWMDRHGRPVSPPMEYARSGPVPVQRYGYGRSTSKDRSIRRVSR